LRLSVLAAGVSALTFFLAIPAQAQNAELAPNGNGEDLSDLSIEQLANIKVRSASKRDEPLSAAPAALYVIDHEQIVRSGAVTIPEILRLAPNLQVYQQAPGRWVVTARGLNGNPGLQSFSNKLLVLVDGRTVYAPHFSGVYWDLPDVLPDDIDRIEVISGPGATLWGANAVNGVINIVTRPAASSAGAFVDVRGGDAQQAAGLRFAGTLGKDVNYRVYGRWLHEDAGKLSHGASAHDGWHRRGAGFRLDWAASARDSVNLQGDIFAGRLNEPVGTHEGISGYNLVARWNRDTGDGHGFQLQAFYDRIHRSNSANAPKFHIDTYDVDFQHSLGLGDRHELVLGGGARIAHYQIGNIPFYFDPSSRNLFIGNLFVQDSFSLTPAVTVTAGLKAEHDPFVGFSLLPNMRLAVTPSETVMLWGAASRAVRSPTPFDTDVRESVGNIIAITGNRNFRNEKLTALEIGIRAQPLSEVSFSVTGFYHRYDDLRTIELGTGPALLNFFWGNKLKGYTRGVEAWATVRPLSWWTLSAGATVLSEDFDFKPGATGPFAGTGQNGTDPKHQFNLQSSMNVGQSVKFDLHFRAVGRLRGVNVPAYNELGGRVAWDVADHLTLSLSGFNLLHARHVEYSGGDAIPRKVLVGLEWRP
jgi:iron complex outermembrane receptor protein